MQGKSVYYSPSILRASGVFGFYIKTPGLNRGFFITLLNTFYFQRKR